MHNSTNQQYLFDFKIWTDIKIQAKLGTLSSFAKEKPFQCVQVENAWLPGKIIPEIYGCLKITKQM